MSYERNFGRSSFTLNKGHDDQSKTYLLASQNNLYSGHQFCEYFCFGCFWSEPYNLATIAGVRNASYPLLYIAYNIIDIEGDFDASLKAKVAAVDGVVHVRII